MTESARVGENYKKVYDDTTNTVNEAENNYNYDAIGNMISTTNDTITNITWNVYGKIMSVTMNGRAIRYVHDPVTTRIINISYFAYYP